MLLAKLANMTKVKAAYYQCVTDYYKSAALYSGVAKVYLWDVRLNKILQKMFHIFINIGSHNVTAWKGDLFLHIISDSVTVGQLVYLMFVFHE